MLVDVIKKIVQAEIQYLKADWWILLLGISIAVIIKVYVGSDSLKSWINKNEKVSIFGSIAFGSFTPLCACGTMAVILSMFVSQMPWAPIMAFLVSSPLTSPSQFIFQTEFLGFNLALAVLISSIILGIGAGVLANILSKKTVFFENQFRISFEEKDKNNKKPCSVNKTKSKNILDKYEINSLVHEFYNLGIKKVLFYFLIFIAIGQLVELFVPTEWILSLFSSENVYSIPLSALIGLPLYISGMSSLPLLKTILELGAGGGAVLAFLIAGQGTGVAVIVGLSTIIKKRALAFYISFIFLGAVFSGYIYQLLII
ncbi:MAG: permease [Halanaerobiales bacterium]|nr:permease [Halanaerobiales bacterium]